MSSVVGSMGHPGAVALYVIAKAALDAAARQLALEYGSKGARVLLSSVAPGLINTPAIDKSWS
jgi:NAD(P)-dependent dehydrogenase (short-subunit alcohol dehydrogenase family)